MMLLLKMQANLLFDSSKFCILGIIKNKVRCILFSLVLLQLQFYFAGLLVGSLEILGNPTGFLRNVGNGVADMFRMPYQGLTKGPGAFLAGVTRGSSSLLWHLSTGSSV